MPAPCLCRMSSMSSPDCTRRSRSMCSSTSSSSASHSAGTVSPGGLGPLAANEYLSRPSHFGTGCAHSVRCAMLGSGNSDCIGVYSHLRNACARALSPPSSPSPHPRQRKNRSIALCIVTACHDSVPTRAPACTFHSGVHATALAHVGMQCQIGRGGAGRGVPKGVILFWLPGSPPATTSASPSPPSTCHEYIAVRGTQQQNPRRSFQARSCAPCGRASAKAWPFRCSWYLCGSRSNVAYRSCQCHGRAHPRRVRAHPRRVRARAHARVLHTWLCFVDAAAYPACSPPCPRALYKYYGLGPRWSIRPRVGMVARCMSGAVAQLWCGALRRCRQCQWQPSISPAAGHRLGKLEQSIFRQWGARVATDSRGSCRMHALIN